MNMIDIQDKLKNLSEDQLIREMQMPSGQAPQFLVLSEITRRKKMRDGFKAQEAKQGVPSVAEEVMAAAAVPQQGLPQMASAMAPKSSIEQNTGIASLPTQAPVQRMASGGLVQKMAEGGSTDRTLEDQYAEYIRGGHYKNPLLKFFDPVENAVGALSSYKEGDYANSAVNAASVLPVGKMPMKALSAVAPDIYEYLMSMDQAPMLEFEEKYASGGLVQKMADGGRIVVRNGKRFIEREDGTLVPETRSMSMLENLQQFPAEIAAIPGMLGTAFRDYSAGFADEMNADLSRTGDEAMRRQMAEDVYGMRAGPDTSYQYPPVPTMDTTGLDQIAAAFSRTGPMTGGKTPQQLAMEAAQPQLPPAPLSPFGPDFEYGGRGPAVDLDLTAPEPYLPGAAAATELSNPAIMAALSSGAGAGLATGLRDAAANAPPAPVETGDPMLQFQENFDVGLDQGPSPGIAERIFGLPALEKAGLIDDQYLPGPEAATELDNPAIRAALGVQEEGDQGAETPAPAATEEVPEGPNLGLSTTEGGGGTGAGQGGSGSGSGTPSGQGGYISELEDALARAERTKEQDKWLALAQAGLALMASKQPTLGGAIGEAGQVGIEAFRGARDTYENSRMSILEAIAAQRAAAAKALGAGRGGKPMTIAQYIDQLNAMEDALYSETTNDLGEKTKVLIPNSSDALQWIQSQRLEAVRRAVGAPPIDAATLQ